MKCHSKWNRQYVTFQFTFIWKTYFTDVTYSVHLDQTCKKTIFTQAWLEPKIFYPKKCVNLDKSNSQQNSAKDPKDPNSAKKWQKVT